MRETVIRTEIPISVALVTDLHNRPYQPVLQSLRQRRPDLIAVAGDMVYCMQPAAENLMVKEQENVLPFLAGCAELAQTCISLGNHEQLLCPEDIRLIRETGAQVLDNTWTERNGVVIGGLSSGYVTGYRRLCAELGCNRETNRYPRLENAQRTHDPDCSWLDRFVAVPGFHILLCHHPEYWPLICRKRIELTMSGHSHGGQWRIFGHGVFAPGQGFWPKYTSGLYENRLVVSRGLANTTRFPRINNPTEIVYLVRK